MACTKPPPPLPVDEAASKASYDAALEARSQDAADLPLVLQVDPRSQTYPAARKLALEQVRLTTWAMSTACMTNGDEAQRWRGCKGYEALTCQIDLHDERVDAVFEPLRKLHSDDPFTCPDTLKRWLNP